MTKIAIVTPSYSRDLLRCELLAEGVSRFASSEYHHVVIVPRSDRAAFLERVGHFGATVIVQEDLLPAWLAKVPFSQKWQLSPFGLPVRGWIRQQVVKMAYACQSSSDALLYVDSDICFVRPFDASLVVRHDGRVRLLCEPGVGDQDPHHEWYRRSARLLRLPVKDYFGNGFIGPLATWVPAHARGVTQRIEATTRDNWKKTLLHQITMSEYILYGLFIQEVIGVAASRHFVDERPNPVLQHYIGVLTDQNLLKFLDGIDQHHIAILIQSNAPYSFDLYSNRVRRLWQS